MDVRCPDCKSKISIDDIDEGDIINCPACNLELIAVVKKKKIKLESAKDHYLDEEDDFDAAFDETFEEE